MSIHVVIHNPVIPNNTGNIIRTTACVGAKLHIVEPLGFTIDSTKIKRAGIDYHDLSHMQVHPSWKAILAELIHKPTAAESNTNIAINSKSAISQTDFPAQPISILSEDSLQPRIHPHKIRHIQTRRIIAFSSHAHVRHDQIKYQDEDVLLFGTEPTGLPPDILYNQHVYTRVRIPLRPYCRSINLSNAVAIALFEAWRQMKWSGASFDESWRTHYR